MKYRNNNNNKNNYLEVQNSFRNNYLIKSKYWNIWKIIMKILFMVDDSKTFFAQMVICQKFHLDLQ